MPDVVSASAVVDAPAQQVFDLLADPRRHPDLDGSGTLRAAISGPSRLSLGARFGMRMRLGLPYAIVNEVVEFEEGRRIAWRHLSRAVWRYELEPLDQGRTLVTESWDAGPSPIRRLYRAVDFHARNRRSIEATLARLQHLVVDDRGPERAAR